MAGIRLDRATPDQTGPGNRVSWTPWTVHRAEVADEPGCLQHSMFEDVSDERSVVLFEHWASPAAFGAHRERENAQPGGPGVPAVAELIVPPADSVWGVEFDPHAVSGPGAASG